MENRQIRYAVVSTDAAFREALGRALTGSGQPYVPGTEIRAPFTRIGDEQLAELRHVPPGLLFLDLEQDPSVGIKFAQFLGESMPDVRIVAAGPELPSHLLIEAMRAGIAEYLTKPVSTDDVQAAVGRLERKLGSPAGDEERDPGRVIAFFSPKGGSGATTAATNLAIHLHRLTGKRTLLADLDLELGEIALLLGLNARFNFVDMVRNFHRMDAGLLASYIERHASGVHVLSAPYHPDSAEAVEADQIRKILHFLRQHYDYVVVDTSKSFSPATLATLEMAERVFLLSTADLPSLRNVKRSMPLLERITGGGAPDRLQLVVNRYQPSDDISPEDIRRTLGIPVAWTLSNDYEAVINSITEGKPLVLGGNSRYARDLKALGAAVAGLATPGEGRGAERAGVSAIRHALRRLTGRAEGAPAHA